MYDFTVIVPVYNEEKKIKNVIDELKKYGYKYLIVDDGSTDDTLKIIKENTKYYESYPHNLGKGFAIKYGADAVETDWIILADGDGQINLKSIEALFIPVKQNPDLKIVLGNRLLLHRGMPKLRYIANVVMSYIVSLITKQYIADANSGIRLVHKDVFNLESKCDRFDYDIEMLLLAAEAGYKIGHIPYTCSYTEEDNSKINLVKDSIRFLKVILGG